MGRAQGEATAELSRRGAAAGDRTPESSGAVVKCRLYRSGQPEKSADYGVAHDYFAAADKERPSGRVGRLEGLFCSPSLAGMSRWYLANLQSGAAYVADPYELFYEGPEPYAYPVEAWDRASRLESEESYRSYWQAGVLLSNVLADPSHYPASDWEVLADPAFVRSMRPIRPRRAIEAAPADLAEQLMSELFHRQWFKGVIYNAEAQALRDADLG